MTPDEFDQWMAGYFRLLPDTKSWFMALGPDDRPAVRESWVDVMGDVELKDANAVTRRILSGDDPPVPANDREMTPAHVRMLAKINQERRQEQDRRRLSNSHRESDQHVGFSVARLLEQVLDTMKLNPDLSAVEVAEQIMPPAEENPNGRRYDCLLCLDSGIVMVWASVSIQAQLRGELNLPGKRRTCGAPCSCRAGDHYVWRNSGDPPKGWTGWTNQDAVYSAERYCVCYGNDTESLIAIESFKDWVAERVLAADRREPAFADWNAGGKENAVAN